MRTKEQGRARVEPKSRTPALGSTAVATAVGTTGIGPYVRTVYSQNFALPRAAGTSYYTLLSGGADGLTLL